ncbi:alpha/beta hydrolase [Rufibacter psychrotolerans]|uniref:alpha/beta hydrolase n=1 Tax=Rufibacter psychrotolerans TaxID=2812556 RepID=UPI001967AEE4|nr:alpha/beta hydrolase [Rufibacter sp. SYSU D00308]
MKTIIFIHGMFQNPRSWEQWVTYFTERGYNCLAPAWPLHDGEPAELRANPPAGLGELGLDDIISEMETHLLNQGTKPIVIGHSVGGLLTQIFANRDMISVGVPICSVAPNGMIDFDLSFFKNSATIANPLKGDEPAYMDLETFHAAFANTLSEADVREAYERTATHDSRNVFRDCMGPSGKIDLDRPHVPLLFISAAEDKICPADLVAKNVRAYDEGTGAVALKEFPHRSHFICGEPGWEEVANYIYQWLETRTP